TIGGLLALSRVHLVKIWPKRKRALADLVGVPALIVTLTLWAMVAQTNPGLYAGGLVLVSLVSAALIYASVEGRLLPGALGVSPLVSLGKISYGVYVFHFPIFLVLTEE